MYSKRMNLIGKRFLDITCSFIGVIILLPLFIIISIAIRIDSEGPIFFKQQRLGRKGTPFQIYKFRTMIVNAESIGEGLKISNNSDSRITRVGSFLRKTSLDEIPQLINVFIGEMSLVGPRPPVVYYPYNGYDSYPEWAKKRFEMSPGVTGLAQVRVRNSVVWDERIKIDNEYINSFNILLDIKILLITLRKVFDSENIY